MLAYRLGQLPSDLDRPSEKEKLPQGPRLSVSQAALVKLPDGTLLASARAEQVYAWFVRLVEQAGTSKNILGEILSGLDLEQWEDRWYALNEILELGAAIRDAFEGKVREVKVIGRTRPGMSRQELEEVLHVYGLRSAISRKANGQGSVYAQRNTPPRIKIYVGSLAALEEGALVREQVIQKLERKLAECNQEAAA